jgi:SAM-dependent methyltransferase
MMGEAGMRSAEVLIREEHEREAFSRVAHGRSAVRPEDMVTRPEEIARYRACADGSRSAVCPLERLFALGQPAPGKRFLEICGHHGEYGALLAHLGAVVDSVDIAEPLVAMAQQRARLNHLEDRLRPRVMSVHELDFADDTFDVVFGQASLHHLDVVAARDEIHRVLKPGGYGVFSEPVQLFPAMRTLRALVPLAPDAESPDERPLSKTDLDDFCRPFERVEIFHYRLLGRLDRLVPAFGRGLARIDRQLLDLLPVLRPTAGGVLLRVWKGKPLS